jgi:hypothetical protein
MNAASIDEPPIDISLEHYMEECALAIALAMAEAPEEQARIEHLANLRADLMERRRSHLQAAAVNAIAPSRREMNANVQALYMAQGTSEDVLRVHARTYFTDVLVSKRMSLSLMPADIAEPARELHAHEESFARAWIRAIGDSSFADQMRALSEVTTTTSGPTASSSPLRTVDRNR